MKRKFATARTAKKKVAKAEDAPTPGLKFDFPLIPITYLRELEPKNQRSVLDLIERSAKAIPACKDLLARFYVRVTIVKDALDSLYARSIHSFFPETAVAILKEYIMPGDAASFTTDGMYKGERCTFVTTAWCTKNSWNCHTSYKWCYCSTCDDALQEDELEANSCMEDYDVRYPCEFYVVRIHITKPENKRTANACEKVFDHGRWLWIENDCVDPLKDIAGKYHVRYGGISDRYSYPFPTDDVGLLNWEKIATPCPTGGGDKCFCHGCPHIDDDKLYNLDDDPVDAIPPRVQGGMFAPPETDDGTALLLEGNHIGRYTREEIKEILASEAPKDTGDRSKCIGKVGHLSNSSDGWWCSYHRKLHDEGWWIEASKETVGPYKCGATGCFCGE